MVHSDVVLALEHFSAGAPHISVSYLKIYKTYESDTQRKAEIIHKKPE